MAGQRGFTLLEIMVVVVILAILAAVAVPQFAGAPDEARSTKAKQDIRAIEAALNMYRLDNYRYPSTEQGLEALVRQPSGNPPAANWRSGGYLARLPEDPWGNAYLYLNPGRNGTIDIYSLGRDGQPGGEDADEDIGNWMLN
jgi:general secretion pathway protein G